MSDPATIEAERLAEKATGKRKIDEVIEVTEPTESSKNRFMHLSLMMLGKMRY